MERLMQKPKMLLVDDNEAFLDLFLSLSDTENLDITTSNSAENALDVLNNEKIDLIVTDIQMPGASGIELFTKVQDLYPHIPVILITAYGSTAQAIAAVKQGAFHYFEKPLDDKLDLFWTTVREALAKGEMLKQIALLQKEKTFGVKTDVPIIGQSTAIMDVLQSVKDISGLPVTVLISGETGTGKELVAQSIHEMSDRKSHPFFAISCSELSPGVLESELFGHERGAFTGAVGQKKGLFEVVHKGTLFLDEIGDASLRFQTKLLRVLETKKFTRVGGTAPIQSDFRVIAATNRNLETDVEKGRFRQDLFFRINVYNIPVPPLRSRKEDIPSIAEYYRSKFCQAFGRSIERFSENALTALCMYDWPGNVRELINVVERAVITCKSAIITTRHLPFDARIDENTSGLELKDMEKIFIERALKRTSNNKTRAADLLGISRKTLIDKVKKYNLEPD
jgi:DNA-binding NtrC family response regulator